MLTHQANALASICHSLDLLEELRRARWLLDLAQKTDCLDNDPEQYEKLGYLLDRYLEKAMEIEKELTVELEDARQCLTLCKS
jgi:hypothetical protein